MAERKWGAIASGATFESLVTTLIFFKDPGASLFGRRGKDGGQDARSSDRKRVFQAKHHQGGLAATAIRDAKREAKKITAYREPTHARHAQWANVSHWRLVTNCEFNPTDQQSWDAEIVPLFAGLGLAADFWERAALDAMLDEYPEVHRSYFENETRVFLSIPEKKERIPADEPFLRREELGPFCGRTSEKSAIREFLNSEHLFLVVHGSGGTGKTRLLVDSGEEIASGGDWQVLWANVESMAAGTTWFDAIVPERASVLLVDEPRNDGVLQQLAEQLGGRVGRTAKWKVVVAVRSPKDPVLRFLRRARMKQRVQELSLSPLLPVDAEEMCFQLLDTGPRAGLPNEVKREAARHISKQFARYPVWMTLAIHHLEGDGDLKQIPADAEKLADEYLSEIENDQSSITSDSVRALLRWIALLGTVNREDDTTIKFIGERCGIPSLVEVRQRLADLIRRRALVARGAHNRLIELKPDVLRDHILLRWLATDVGVQDPQVSRDGQELVRTVQEAISAGDFSGLVRGILVSLARTDFILRLAGHDFGLLITFFGFLELSLNTMSASQRVGLADVLEAIAHFQPRSATSLVAALRQNEASDETVDGVYRATVVTHADVVLALAWPLFGAAMGAETAEDKEAILRELCKLTEAEAELTRFLTRGLPNDGKRASTLVTRVIEGGPQFWSDYDDTAKLLSTELIDKIAKAAPSAGQIALLAALVEPLLDTERRQSWSDDRSFTWRTITIEPGGSAWDARQALLEQIKRLLRTIATPLESRVQLWHLFAQARDESALERLKWTHDVLNGRPTSIEELGAAREVWNWHRQYDKDVEIRAAADALELLYSTNALAREFRPLLPSPEDWKEHENRVAQKAADLALASSSDAISDFLDRAESFLAGRRALDVLSGVAWSLGTHAESSDSVRMFVQKNLEQNALGPRFEFAASIAAGWLVSVRKSAPSRAHTLAENLIVQCTTDEQRVQILARFYARIPKSPIWGNFSVQERALLYASSSLW